MKAADKKDWAKLLYTKEGLSQKEVAGRTGVSTVTINKWVNANEAEWDKLRKSLLVTRDEQLRRLYMQLDELNTHIMLREKGSRFANSKEADTINKLTVSIRTLETDASIADIVEVCKRVLNYLRPISPEKAREMAMIFDDFIKDTLRR
ncbi:MAG: helix-turn-helix domain-containing protein [Bacteroidota bacterium]